MATPKSNEGKAARKIADVMNQRGLNNSLLAYFLLDYMPKETRNELIDVFMHIIKAVDTSDVPDYLTADEANFRLLCDSIVRAVEDAGYRFT